MYAHRWLFMLSFVEAVHRMASVALTLLDQDRPLLGRTVEFTKWILEERYDGLVKAHVDTPMLQAFQGDASPMLVRQRWMHRIGLSSYNHEASRKVDWYSTRAYLTLVDDDGAPHVRSLLRDPVLVPNKDNSGLKGPGGN